MTASVTPLSRSPDVLERSYGRAIDDLMTELAEVRAENVDLQRRLALAEKRADRAERWLRAVVIELTWPAALGAIVGGALTVGWLWAAGL